MKRNDWILFLIGLGSETQIRLVGYIGISELILFVIGPFIFMRNYYRLKHDGFMPLIWLTWLAFLGGWASGMLNDVPMRSILKGVAAPYSVFCAICTIHHFLSRDLKSVRYFFIGIAFSFVISRFIFQPGNISVSRGVKLKQEEAAVAALTSSLFLIQLLGYGLTIPVYGWFKKVPKLYCVVALLVIGYVGFAMSNNRSSLIMVFASLFLIVVGGKTAHAQKFLRKSFWLVMIGSLLIAPLVNRFYIYSASHGYLGKEAEGKYRAQSKRGTDILSILMSGRTAFFAGLVAAFDKPLIGHGPWAVDYKGYWHKFLLKYGESEELLWVRGMQERGEYTLVPAHSIVVGFWIWYGLGGLMLAFYMGFLYFDVLKNRLATIPALYGYFAFILPGCLWHWLFSPFGGRVNAAMILVLCLIVRNVAKGRMSIKYDTTNQGWSPSLPHLGHSPLPPMPPFGKGEA